MKLIYFKKWGMGLAELSRLILAHAGADYEDCRIEMEEWPDLKPKTVTGTLPMLEVDGVQIGQSIAIARFLAKRFGLVGENDIEMAQADMIVDCLQDFVNEMGQVAIETNEERKNELLDKLKTTRGELLNKMANMLEKNGGEFMVGKKLTWADIAIAGIMERSSSNDSKLLDDFKLLEDLMNKVNNSPNIKAWIKKRPKTEF